LVHTVLYSSIAPSQYNFFQINDKITSAQDIAYYRITNMIRKRWRRAANRRWIRWRRM